MVSFVIAGYPASGKTTSLFPNEELGIKGLPVDKTLYITCAGPGKLIPVPNWRNVFNADKKIMEGGRYLATIDPEKIADVLLYVAEKRPDIKVIVVDDANFTMGKTVMQKSKLERQDWADLGVNTYKMFDALDKITANPKLNRDDLFIIFNFHLSTTEIMDGYLMRTKHEISCAGQMLKKNVPLASLWDIILVTDVQTDPITQQPKYVFRTRPLGDTPARAPYGMFKGDGTLVNDAGEALRVICEYFGLNMDFLN